MELIDYNLLDFYELEFDIRYAVDPLLPAGGIGLIHGKGGHGKTQFAFALMNAITTGDLFLGRYQCQEGKVLYLQFDMPITLFQERLLKARPRTRAPEKVVVVPHKPINITDANAQDAIEALVAKHEPVLVIVDTLRKVHRYDENDNSVPSVVYDAWRDAVGPDIAVIIIHHDRKSPVIQTKGSEDDPIESFRGARAWIDDSDLGIHLYKYGKKNKVKMDFSKLRCAPQDLMHLQLNNETLLIEPKPPETAKEWAEKILSEDPAMEPNELVKQMMERGGVARATAYRVVGEIIPFAKTK